MLEYILDELSNDDLIIYFTQLIDDTFSNRIDDENEKVEFELKALKIGVEIPSINKKQHFINTFDMLYFYMYLSRL